ncbi:MAG: cytochrome b/b6 domain-containing protein [Acidocella sp.]|nr:cytochrome b/b6 domain-containing protein [Acidocella sp.]
MEDKYSAIARSLHWSIAALAILLIIAGLIVRFDLVEKPLRSQIAFLHIGFGLTVLVLMLWRLGVRLTHRPPPLPETLPARERALAHAGHIGLYVLMLIMPVFGVLFVQARDRVVSWFGLLDVPALIGKNDAVHDVFAFLHFWGGMALIALIVVHVGALVWHKRQGISLLPRMWG